MINKRMVLLTTVLSLLMGCSSTGDTTLVFPGSRMDRPEKGRTYPVTSETCGFALFSCIPIMTGSRYERAMESLNAQTVGAYVSEIRMEESWTYALYGTVYCTRFTLTVVR